MKIMSKESNLYLEHEKGKTIVMLREFTPSGTVFTRLFASSDWYVAREYMKKYAKRNGFTWENICFVKRYVSAPKTHKNIATLILYYGVDGNYTGVYTIEYRSGAHRTYNVESPLNFPECIRNFTFNHIVHTLYKDGVKIADYFTRW